MRLLTRMLRLRRVAKRGPSNRQVSGSDLHKPQSKTKRAIKSPKSMSVAVQGTPSSDGNRAGDGAGGAEIDHGRCGSGKQM